MTSSYGPENDFVLWLQDQMEAKGWTALELAKRAGVSQAAISNILRGKRGWGIDLVRAVAAALEVSQIEALRHAGLIDEEWLDDKKATQEYIRLLAAIKDDDKRQEAIDLVETLLRRMGERRKTDSAKRSGRTSAAKSET